VPTTSQKAAARREPVTRRGLGRDAAVAAICGFVVVLMVGASYAAVPFYNWFCRATGFNGTTQVATSAPSSAPLARKIAVRFDANVAPNMGWKFEPSQSVMRVAVGARQMAFFDATNTTDHAITGQAVYNVTPAQAGAYFDKIQCFCFNEQTLKPGERAHMPVIFYVDPKILNDPDANDISEITLSYTFYPVDSGKTSG